MEQRLMGKLNPTFTLTAREFVAVEEPLMVHGLDDEQLVGVIIDAEKKASVLARRLGLVGEADRLPAYIWSIVFANAAK